MTFDWARLGEWLGDACVSALGELLAAHPDVVVETIALRRYVYFGPPTADIGLNWSADGSRQELEVEVESHFSADWREVAAQLEKRIEEEVDYLDGTDYAVLAAGENLLPGRYAMLCHDVLPRLRAEVERLRPGSACTYHLLNDDGVEIDDEWLGEIRAALDEHELEPYLAALAELKAQRRAPPARPEAVPAEAVWVADIELWEVATRGGDDKLEGLRRLWTREGGLHREGTFEAGALLTNQVFHPDGTVSLDEDRRSGVYTYTRSQEPTREWFPVADPAVWRAVGRKEGDSWQWKYFDAEGEPVAPSPDELPDATK